MSNLLSSATALVTVLTLSACNGGSGTFTAAPTPSPTPQPANISGDYSGTMTDTLSGAGTASGTLTQHGNNAGGAISDVVVSGTATAQIAISISETNATSGSMVIAYPSGPTCTFSTTGTYTNNGTTAVLSGTYTAVTNCAGDSGSYSLNQQCTYTVTPNARRAQLFPVAC